MHLDNEKKLLEVEAWWQCHLLRERRHVHRLDLPQGGQPLQSLPGLLLHRYHEGVLHVAVLCQFLCCIKTKILDTM